MEIIEKTEDVKKILAPYRTQGVLGLIPTMGALHEGHLSLIHRARQMCDCVCVSIFVNPLQFNSQNDLQSYPQNLESDFKLIKNLCDVVFVPSVSDFYPSTPQTNFDFGSLNTLLEGALRPGHFSGVGLVVSRLFNRIQPHYAFFGLKDIQQFFIVKRLIEDLSFPIKLIGCATVRDERGLALSSRNRLLSANGKKEAAHIYQGLTLARTALSKEGSKLSEIKNKIIDFYSQKNEITIEYFEFLDEHFNIIENNKPQKVKFICVAAYIEGVRIIDNLSLHPDFLNL